MGCDQVEDRRGTRPARRRPQQLLRCPAQPPAAVLSRQSSAGASLFGSRSRRSADFFHSRACKLMPGKIFEQLTELERVVGSAGTAFETPAVNSSSTSSL